MAHDEHKVLYQELTALVAKHAHKITAIEVCAVASNMVGKLIAMQDQREYTPATVMEIVIANLQAGNEEVMLQLEQTKGSG